MLEFEQQESYMGRNNRYLLILIEHYYYYYYYYYYYSNHCCYFRIPGASNQDFRLRQSRLSHSVSAHVSNAFLKQVNINKLHDNWKSSLMIGVTPRLDQDELPSTVMSLKQQAWIIQGKSVYSLGKKVCLPSTHDQLGGYQPL